jgi:hypothetical protein
MKKIALTAALLFCFFGAVGCGSSRDKPLDDGQVATLNGRPVTLEEFQVYLEISMPSEEEALEQDREVLDQVQSRVFDDFIDECLLELEGRARFESDPDPLERLFAEIAREALLENPVTPEEVHAFLNDRMTQVDDAEGQNSRTLSIRSLMFEVEATAKKVYMDVRRDRVTFDEAAAAHETTPGQSRPFGTTLGSLPEEVRQAINSLKPGWVSPPVEVHGSFYLFVVDEWTTREVSLADPDWQAEAAAILRSRRIQAATARFVQELRKKPGIRIDPSRLAFQYVPESPVQVE